MDRDRYIPELLGHKKSNRKDTVPNVKYMKTNRHTTSTSTGVDSQDAIEKVTKSLVLTKDILRLSVDL